jgi:hypothetical protein
MYSVAAAAAVTGLSKTNMLRAIQAGRISATKNEINEWQVDLADLHRLNAPVAGRSEATGSAGDAPPADGELRPRAVLAEQSWLDDMAQAKRLARLATSDQKEQQAARTRWWRRVTGA